VKVFVIGKIRSITHWTEDCIAGFQAAGHEVRLGVSRDPRLNVRLERILMSRWTGAVPVQRLCRNIRAFRPELILVIDPFGTPLPLLEPLAAMRARPPLVGWVGDQFPDTARTAADLFDAIAYTDTGLLALHRTLGFARPAFHVPHAANPRLDRGIAALGDRRQRMVFVASRTPHRSTLIAGIQAPIALYGSGWGAMANGPHEVYARRIGIDELASVYRDYLAVLNIRHEFNVVHGLNQRHFDPYLAGTPVVTDDQPDLSASFDLGSEVLVYRNADELNDIHARLLRDPDTALKVGEHGRRRVMAQHLYGHRLDELARISGRRIPA
jgi:spore maturation protein CgeB